MKKMEVVHRAEHVTLNNTFEFILVKASEQNINLHRIRFVTEKNYIRRI